MPTATELLSTEACDDILVVDLESRTIVIPKTVSVLGVEADDETRILHFQVPQYYCNVDLSEFSIRVNYKNANGEPDMYLVLNKVVENGLIKFDWVVGRHAFAKKGNVKFSICLKDLFEGVVRREFNTAPATLPVLEGLETGYDLSEGHTDVFEQLREELMSSSTTFLGDNPTGGVANDTVDIWRRLGPGFAWISELDQVNDQPSQYGFIINYAHHLDVFQIFQDQMNGDTYIRCGDQNASWIKSWRRIPTTNAGGELIVDGNIKGNYVTGEWLRTVAEDAHRTDPAEKIAVIDGSGWIYYRTPAELRSDMNLYSKEEVDAAIAAAIAKLG